ncbi:major facilitator superfamily domain-containing protein [Phyllosticta citricarpa]
MRHSSWRSVSVLLTPGAPSRSNSKSTVNTSDEPTPRIEVTIPTPQLDIPLPKRQYDDTYGDDHSGPAKPNRTYRIHDIEKTSSENGLFPASSSVYSSAGSYSPPINALAVRAPDGGGVAWATALAGFLVAFNCWGLNFAFGALEPWYRNTLLKDHAASQIAWIGSTQMALLFLVAPLASLLYDYGYFRFLFNGGTVLLLGACLATSWCRTWVTLFVAQGLVTGIANGMVFCSGVRVLMGLFDKRVGLAFGTGAMGASVGGIVFTLAVHYLLPETGFGSTYRVLALIVLVTMLFPTLVVRPWAGESRTAKEKVRLGVVFLDGAFWVMIVGMFFAFWGLLSLDNVVRGRIPRALDRIPHKNSNNIPPNHARRQPPRPTASSLPLRHAERAAQRAGAVRPLQRRAALQLHPRPLILSRALHRICAVRFRQWGHHEPLRRRRTAVGRHPHLQPRFLHHQHNNNRPRAKRLVDQHAQLQPGQLHRARRLRLQTRW